MAILCESRAQVTIGMHEAPVTGALLQLKEKSGTGQNSSKGLLLPRVKLKSLSGDLATTLGATSGSYNNKSHVGLTIYSVAKDENSLASRLCPGLHIWTGDKWEPIVSYPPIVRKEEFVKYTEGRFVYLDPMKPNEEGWRIIGKNPANYGPLGERVQITDTRDNEKYYTTRFYIGYLELKADYAVKESYSCDVDVLNFIDLPNEIKVAPASRKFEDGVWMNENLRAKVFTTPRDNPNESIFEISERGTSEIVTEAGVSKWGYPNNSASNAASMGLLYTWNAATNGKGGDNGWLAGDELDIKEGEQIQGICPTGWHLPSDRQWTDLENGIILKTSLFSTVSDIGEDGRLSYTQLGARPIGANDSDKSHSFALRSTDSGNDSGTPITKGKSFPYTQGGFDAHNSGFISYYGTTVVYSYFNQGAGWWTSSGSNGSDSKYTDRAARRLAFGYKGPVNSWENPYTVSRDTEFRRIFHSVRCMKNTD